MHIVPESEIADSEKNAVSVPKVTTSADIVAYSLFGDQWSFEVQHGATVNVDL